ncbi:hypothetical protein COU78_04505 [Candidatus Peregrinibacteria bacterium CG10_big_fil_rev_8_21_14_0_10_49_24]|nr:MAG: hypothetical protein COU78_04505 [Candidatus Peregrinibacteria bacterium CG10_big_fil_rev_8_21_14_0_10_49_24]PJA67295.1 MAG: hypothetical protein CO157_05385 [Candidatus Peregrinibacteria bacterium CG_4_9_14_3_um_filter_49_12]
MTKKPTTAANSKPENRKMAEQIYNMLMAEIEPELLLETIPSLDAKYKGESPEEHKERMKRYKAAYKKFDTQLAEFMGKVKNETRVSKRAALHKQELSDRASEKQDLINIEAAFN